MVVLRVAPTLVLIAWVIIIPRTGASASNPERHCKADEETLFQCRLGTKRVAVLCRRHEAAEGPSRLKFRLLRPGNRRDEIAFEDTEGPKSRFRVTRTHLMFIRDSRSLRTVWFRLPDGTRISLVTEESEELGWRITELVARGPDGRRVRRRCIDAVDHLDRLQVPGRVDDVVRDPD